MANLKFLTFFDDESREFLEQQAHAAGKETVMQGSFLVVKDMTQEEIDASLQWLHQHVHLPGGGDVPTHVSR